MFLLTIQRQHISYQNNINSIYYVIYPNLFIFFKYSYSAQRIFLNYNITFKDETEL